MAEMTSNTLRTLVERQPPAGSSSGNRQNFETLDTFGRPSIHTRTRKVFLSTWLALSMLGTTSLAWAPPNFNFRGRESQKCGRGEVKYPLDPDGVKKSDFEKSKILIFEI